MQNHSTEIKKVEKYLCPTCLRDYLTKAETEKCLADCTAREEENARQQKIRDEWDVNMDRIRLEAESVSDVKRLLIKYAKEYFKMDLKFTEFSFRFGPTSNTHGCPIGGEENFGCKPGRPTSYLGWDGHIKVEYKKVKKEGGRELYFSEIFRRWEKGFRGFHTGTGGGGSDGYSCHFYFFLDDFPKLKAKYELFQELQKKKDVYSEQLRRQTQQVYDLINELAIKDQNWLDVNEAMNKVESEIVELQRKKEKLRQESLKIAAIHSKQANKEREGKFKIPKMFEYDVETLNALTPYFQQRGYREEF
jgi:hypothetical protein